METLKALEQRQHILRLSLSVNHTIVDAEGVEHYKRLCDFLKPLGIQNNVVTAYDLGAAYYLKDEMDAAPRQVGQFTTFSEFPVAHLHSLFGEIGKDFANYPLLDRLAKRYFPLGIRNRLLQGEGAPNPNCAALNSQLRLLPDGRVPTCQFNTISVGNLRESDFADPWPSARIQKRRGWVGKCPECWAECEVLPNAIYTGDLFQNSLFPKKSP
ncbi:MAG: SPASM domain-containing protein [Candidatus Poribacteria bacterium]|nr:SPASM domain-containing protein [Candidatus Poribacteria bacterium]